MAVSSHRIAAINSPHACCYVSGDTSFFETPIPLGLASCRRHLLRRFISRSFGAAIISEYESDGSGPVLGVHAVVALLEFIETSTMPNGTIGKVSIGIHHGEFITDLNALDDFRSQLCDLEQHILNILDRTESRRIRGESSTNGP